MNTKLQEKIDELLSEAGVLSLTEYEQTLIGEFNASLVNGEANFSKLLDIRKRHDNQRDDYHHLLFDLAIHFGIEKDKAEELYSNPIVEAKWEKEADAKKAEKEKINAEIEREIAQQRTWRDDPAIPKQIARIKKCVVLTTDLALFDEIVKWLTDGNLLKGQASDYISKLPEPPKPPRKGEVRCWECGGYVIPSKCPNGQWDGGMGFYCGC